MSVKNSHFVSLEANIKAELEWLYNEAPTDNDAKIVEGCQKLVDSVIHQFLTKIEDLETMTIKGSPQFEYVLKKDVLALVTKQNDRS